MPRRRVVSSAIATCAAASLTSPVPAVVTPELGPTESVSASAVARLGAHAAADARQMLAVGSSRRPRRLLARAQRRLRLAHVLSIELQAVDDTLADDVAVSFTAAARVAVERFGHLARRPGGRLEGSAVRALRRAALMQCEVAARTSVVQDIGSRPGRQASLRSVLDAQQALVAALDQTVASGDVRADRRRSLRSAATQAEQVHDMLATALGRLRLAGAEDDEPIGPADGHSAAILGQA